MFRTDEGDMQSQIDIINVEREGSKMEESPAQRYLDEVLERNKKIDEVIGFFDKLYNGEVYAVSVEQKGKEAEPADQNADSEFPKKVVVDGVPYYYDHNGRLYRIGNQYYDDNGKLYRTGNELQPNNTYEINGYKYKTDEQGRIISAEGRLHMKDREGRLPIRDSKEDIGKGDQKSDDDRGHLIGDQFDGSNGLENMIPQNAEINGGIFRDFENELAKEVKNGKEVRVEIEPQYEGDSRRPTDIVVSYSIDGEEGIRIFPNPDGKEK